ncbi:calpain-type cysteine protease dek1 [Phtheirospermum japonicum]|uniref:Calpain-type cysteine protease dek1 n=1 Tax=Phtheirospermum japonicum TaxID=374723 RepID=A0A830C0G1_9LAMI|nr:calpain-type cysteine protease dek1 [Phtheirospermum japonicum]
MEEEHGLILACVISGTLFSILGAASFVILCWIFARKWPALLQGPQLGILCGLLSLCTWIIVISPVVVLIIWGCWLILILGRDLIGLAVIMAGVALLLAFYSVMLWWRTQWQSSRAVAVLLLLAVGLLCAYELCAVYVTAGAKASERYSPSGFFFGVSAIALAINMLFICRMVFNGNGVDIDEYVRRAYKFAYSDCIEVGPVALHLGLLYFGSLLVLLVYSILYGLTAKESHWLGAITSAAVIILDWNVGTCLYGFKLLKSRVAALFVAGASRVFLICFGVHYWFLGHCISYAIVASVLLGAAVSRHLSITNPSAARRDALESTVIRLREGFRKKENCSSSSSEGCGSSVKRSSSADAGHLANVTAPCTGELASWTNVESEKGIDSGRPSFALHSGSCHSVVQETEAGPSFVDKNGPSLIACSSSGMESQGCESSASNSVSQVLDLNLALAFQEKLSDPRITSILKRRGRQGELELTSLLQDKGLDPNFAVMLKENGLDPMILALLQRSSLDADRDHRDNTMMDSNSVDNMAPNQISFSEELRVRGFEKWLRLCRLVLHYIAGTPERSWLLFSFVFSMETTIVAIFRPGTINLINSTHQQFEFGIAVLLLSPVVWSIMAFLRSLQSEELSMTSKPRKYGFVAWLVSTCVGLLLSFLSKSSVLLGLSLTVPLMVACLSVGIPLWIRNGYKFWVPGGCNTEPTGNRSFIRKEGAVIFICIALFAGSLLALGGIISAKPLDDLRYKGLTSDQKSVSSPYASSVYIGWAVASAIALTVTGVLPIVSWFATYRFSLSSAACIGLFAAILVSFCGASFMTVVNSRTDQIPTKADFLAALLPLICMPAILSLSSGLLKWKDDNWKLCRGAYLFIIIGLVLLLGAISAVTVIIEPWAIGVAFLLVVLLLVLAIGVIHYWASNNFYLTRFQMLFVCFLAFLLALAAFIVGWIEDRAFVGASVGYFSFLFLLAGRALTVLLSPPIVVYSPRVLPVYVYDAHADCGKNVSAAFLVLYGIALAIEGWGVVASLKIYPPFAGAAVSAITLVVAFGFAVSRSCLTLEMVEDAVHFLSKETVVQAIARSATKTRNALSGTYSAPQRSASSAALLVGDPTISRDRAGNFVLPRADVMKLRDRLRNEELAAGPFFSRLRSWRILRNEVTSDVGHRREMCAHARILALEEAIDTEWVYMWDKFGGYLLLLLGLTAKAERVQDEVRLRLFLDSIEKEMEEEALMQRREEEGRGKERRKALLEKEERKWKEIEASLISSIPNAGSREAAAMAAAVRAVGGDSVLDDSFARERTGLAGAVCVLDDEPTTSGRHCGEIDPSLCQSHKVSFSVAVMIQPESGPVCLLGTEFQQKVCWEILVAGSEQGEATCFIDGGYDGYQTGLPLNVGHGIWEQGTEVEDWESDPAEVDLYDRDEVDWDGQYSSGRKRRSEREGIILDVDSFTRRLRKPRIETQEEINLRMRSVELAVKEALLARGEPHFTDQEFPPSDRSLFLDPDNPPLKLQVVSQWMRPDEIVQEKQLSSSPCLFSGTANPSDVSRISEVIITPDYNEEGIYTVRFCIQGEWVPVVVDDWIPCESPGKPAFATSKKGNELWVSILEKAYAKLHGSYEALEGGLVQDALVDLTGGAGEEIDMRSAQSQIDLASGRLWSQILRFKQEGFLLGAGSPSGSDVHVSSCGIVQGHAYSILQVREVDSHKLVQIRNPWANEVEWNGPWSDSSPEWTDRMKHKLKHTPQAKDGIFWMSWQDFQIHFRSIYVCRVYPPEMRYSVHSQWRGYSAGGCQDYETWHQNPQFRLTATGPDASLPIHVFITLTQGVSFSRTTAGFRNYQSSHDSLMFYIGMRILKTRGRRAAYNIYLHESVGGTDYVNSREISCEMVLDPDPKGYTIVPTTIHPGEEAPFVLSVFTKSSVTLEAL